MAGLIRYDRIKTTEARARAIRGETEKLLTIAIKGYLAAQEHMDSVVSDSEKAAQIMAFARKGRFTLEKRVSSNEERADQGKPPLTDKGRRFLEKKFKDLEKNCFVSYQMRMRQRKLYRQHMKQW